MNAFDFVPRYNRRAEWHDYFSRCIYMITITKAEGIPAFSSVEGTPQNIQHRLKPSGRIILEELRALCVKYPELAIFYNSIMPDHIHFILTVKNRIDYHIGKAIGELKGACTRRFGEGKAVFTPGFHDRILMRKGQLMAMKKYVLDNPRRLLIKRLHPDFFQRKLRINIDGQDYDVMGNIFLLRHDLIEQVRVSSKHTADQLAQIDRRWKYTISENGVLVSPFISPKEKAYRDLAIEVGAKLIIIENEGMHERFKPMGKRFDLCAEGRLLIIAPIMKTFERQEMTRTKALQLNDLAAKIAEGNYELAVRL